MGGMRMAGMPIKGGFGLIAVIVIAALLGVNPLTFLGGGDPGAPVENAPPGDDPMRDFVSASSEAPRKRGECLRLVRQDLSRTVDGDLQ
jgi:hypothetical protein